jgi:acyl-coenzyme A thioesterase PaaI-like protein
MREFPAPTAVDPLLIVRSDHACFGCGDDNPIGLRLRFAPDGNGVKASFIPSAEHQGFHEVVHGGIISAVLDEAMAWATAYAGVWAVTGELRVRFRQSLRIGELTNVTARVVGTRSRLVTTAAELVLDRDRSPIATATATFLKVDAETEAAWQARYLRDSTELSAELLQYSPNPAETLVEHHGVGAPGGDAVELETDR